MRVMVISGILLLLVGFFSGAYGIMVGAGGGFVFVPALLMLFNMPPEMAAGTGLLVVLMNALSGLTGYVKRKRIDYRTGILLSIGAAPGSFVGVWLAQLISPRLFFWIFAVVLVVLGLFLLVKKTPSIGKGESSREMDTETRGMNKKKTAYLLLIGVVLGVAATFFGIGGGWLIVPILIYVFGMVPHKAAATSIFSLCLYSAVGVLIHIFHGNVEWSAVLWGGLGVLGGAQLGVYLSEKVSGKLIVQMLSIILIGAGINLILS